MYPSEKSAASHLALALKDLLSWHDFDNTKCIRDNLEKYLKEKVRLYNPANDYLAMFDKAVEATGHKDTLKNASDEGIWEGRNGELRDQIITLVVKYLMDFAMDKLKDHFNK